MPAEPEPEPDDDDDDDDVFEPVFEEEDLGERRLRM